jgi:Glycosyltransferase family 87
MIPGTMHRLTGDSRMQSEAMNSLSFEGSPSRGRVEVSDADGVRKCLIFYLVAFALFWTIAIATSYVRVHRQGKVFGVSTMAFFNADHRFGDFLEFDPVDEHFRSPNGVKGQNYPPSAICLYLLFTRNFKKPLHEYLFYLAGLFSLSGLVVASLLYRSKRNRLLLGSAALLSVAVGYPFLFLIERANMEGTIFALCGAALAAFFTRRYLLFGLLISVAASMKVFPAILFALLLGRKRYWELAVSIALIVPIEIVSLWIIGPSISAAFTSVQTGVGNLGRNYFVAYYPAVVGYDHSLFALIKQLMHVKLRERALDSAILTLSPWYTFAVCAGFLALYWFRIRKLPVLNQAMVLLILGITLPYMSFEYTLTSIFLVWTLFVLYLCHEVSEGKQRLPYRTTLWILGLMAFLFTPAQYIRGGSQIYGGVFQALALAGLAGIIIVAPMRSNLFDSKVSAA